MKHTMTIQAEARTARRKAAVKRLRKAGKIPAIIYGGGKRIMIELDTRQFMHVFDSISESMILDLQVGDEHYDVLLKDYERDIISETVTHIDFYAIEQGKILRAHAPIKLTGSSPGVRLGGILETQLHDIEVECLPRNIPEFIDVDISHLDIHDSIHVRDVAPPEGVKFLTNPEQVIALIASSQADIEEAEADEEGLESPDEEQN